MKLSRRPDGALLVEDRGDQFTRAWKSARRDEKVVLTDGRPAVRKQTDLGVMYLTIHQHAWDLLKQLPRNRPMIHNRVKLCEWCGNELRMAREMEGYWIFKCTRCTSSEIHDKRLIGGTRGAGEHEKT